MTHDSKRARILIVEDESLVALDVERRLRDLDYGVAGIVATGADALEALGAGGVDLVLMDIRLRGQIDGIETAHRAREVHGVPVVFLTGHADDETLRRARLAEPEGFIVKPFKTADLRAAVEIALHRHGARRRLLERARWFSSTLAAVGDGVIAADESGTVVFVNGAAEELTGWSARDATGRPLAAVFRRVDGATGEPLELPSGDTGDVAELGTSGSTRGVVPLGTSSVLLAEDGARIPLDGCIAQIVNAIGKPVGCVLVFRDASLRVEAEAVRHRAGLRVAEARAKGGLVDRLARRLRPELGSVQGLVELLAETPLDDEQRELLGELARSAGYLVAAAEEGFDGLPLETGELLVSPEPFDLRVLCEEVALRYARLARERGLSVVLDYGPDLPSQVVGDPGRLGELLGLFMRNALDHTTSGHVTLAVACAESSADEGLFRFRVVDTGAGIEETDLAGLFDSEETGPAARRGGAPGLVLARRIVEQLGGSLGALSAAGDGSTFGFHLNLEIERQMRVDPLVCAQLAGLRALVADASPTAGRVLARRLAAAGVRVEWVDRGDEARARIHLAREAGDPYRVIVAQAELPGLPGAELCAGVIEQVGPGETSVVLSSARESDEQLAVELGASAFVLVPASGVDWLDLLAGARERDLAGGGETWTRRGLAEARRAAVQLFPAARRRTGVRVLLLQAEPEGAAAVSDLLAGLGARVEWVADRAAAVCAAQQRLDLVIADPRLDGLEDPEVVRALAAAVPARGERDPDSAVARDERVGRPVIALAAAPTVTERARWVTAGYADVLEAPARLADLTRALASSIDPEADGFALAAVLDDAGLAGLDDEEFEELVSEFLQETLRGLGFLREAAEARDAEALRWVASGLMEHSERLGAPALEELCRRLCEVCADELELVAVTLVAELEQEFDRVRLALLRLEE